MIETVIVVDGMPTLFIYFISFHFDFILFYSTIVDVIVPDVNVSKVRCY